LKHRAKIFDMLEKYIKENLEKILACGPVRAMSKTINLK
jgi:hypothetical protein